LPNYHLKGLIVYNSDNCTDVAVLLQYGIYPIRWFDEDAILLLLPAKKMIPRDPETGKGE